MSWKMEEERKVIESPWDRDSFFLKLPVSTRFRLTPFSSSSLQLRLINIKSMPATPLSRLVQFWQRRCPADLSPIRSGRTSALPNMSDTRTFPVQPFLLTQLITNSLENANSAWKRHWLFPVVYFKKKKERCWLGFLIFQPTNLVSFQCWLVLHSLRASFCVLDDATTTNPDSTKTTGQ